MMNKMLKELSRLIIFILLVYTSTFSSAEAQPGSSRLENLEERLDAYKDAFRSGDYTRAASMVSPNMIRKVGGEEHFARLVKKFTDSTIMTLDPTLVEFSKPGEIVSDGNMYISVIRQSIPITTKGIDEELKETYLLFHPNFPATVFEGMDGVFKMSVIAYSEDDGNTWFFAGGNKMSLSVENIKPEILEKLTVPVHTLIFGEDSDKIILYRQNKQWTRSTSGISEGLADESIILTIGEGEQIEDSPSSTTRLDMPDDSLDAYIYLDEHPVILNGAFEETDKQSKDNSINNGSKNKHKPSGNFTYSVFTTNSSRMYHQVDCHELGTGNLLEFDSADEALEAGGMPCEQCNP